jgi:hypothetical protein
VLTDRHQIGDDAGAPDPVLPWQQLAKFIGPRPLPFGADEDLKYSV